MEAHRIAMKKSTRHQAGEFGSRRAPGNIEAASIVAPPTLLLAALAGQQGEEKQ
jgi:hypothetical protein